MISVSFSSYSFVKVKTSVLKIVCTEALRLHFLHVDDSLSPERLHFLHVVYREIITKSGVGEKGSCLRFISQTRSPETK